MSGHVSPTAMLGRLRPSELGLWAALWAIDPWGEDRADLRSGMISSVLANVNRNPKRRSEPFLPMDFMPYRQAEEADRKTALSRKARAVLMAAAGGTKKTRR